MTPAARLQAVIDILSTGTAQPLDRQLKAWFRGHRFAGSGDRRAITERVYAIFRHHAHFMHRMGGDAPRALAIASLLADSENPEGYFSGGYGPAPLSDAERASIAAAPGALPSWVEGEYPAWLEKELQRGFGARLGEEMRAFQPRAPVDIRVNRLKAHRDQVLAQLQADGFECVALANLPDAIRCPAGAALTAHPLYLSGAFEIQDAAAQEAVGLCQAKPGMRVLDLAAGAGGKSLALAAAMQNKGEIVASDIREDALAELSRRATRAGAAIIRTHLLGTSPQGPFDLVLLDAPCSGSGTWRRQPELKWRLTEERLVGLCALQDRLLDQAAGLGPFLVYATCSILMRENRDRVEAFLSRHPGFSRAGAEFHASPATTGSDGFYAARLQLG
ncbi:MAG TPA: RsmB/NOP family class I SAM-dependent RNA methyltransferase [Rhizomicrobium sp.]|nr:RsmB/NOP family class I SAM-dependent RNA methyltransferase [Rhizomicrobium sp.]